MQKEEIRHYCLYLCVCAYVCVCVCVCSVCIRRRSTSTADNSVYVCIYLRICLCTCETHVDDEHTVRLCKILHHAVTHCNTLQHTATRCLEMEAHVASIRNALQHTATQCKNTTAHCNCNALQHTATLCNTHCEARVYWIPVSRRVRMYDMTNSYAYHPYALLHMHGIYDACVCHDVHWQRQVKIPSCSMTHSYACHDSSICMSKLIHICTHTQRLQGGKDS